VHVLLRERRVQALAFDSKAPASLLGMVAACGMMAAARLQVI
jgi:hypothetical protein